VGLFCKGTCDQCEYYLIVKDQRPNVLVVTDRKGLGRTIEKETAHAEFNLQVVDCEYKCSMFIENFRPDYVVIDCSLGLERSRQMSKLLYEDPRLPFVRIVLAGGTGKLARECDKMVFATISKRLTASMLLDIVEGDSPRKVEELPQSSEGGRPQAAKGGDARRK
jgi:DNA-binding NtrC family response regulator